MSAFNSGEECRPVERTSQQYGQEACTLSVESNPVDSQPLKKSRKDRPVIESNDGNVEFAMVNLHAHHNMRNAELLKTWKILNCAAIQKRIDTCV